MTRLVFLFVVLFSLSSCDTQDVDPSTTGPQPSEELPVIGGGAPDEPDDNTVPGRPDTDPRSAPDQPTPGTDIPAEATPPVTDPTPAVSGSVGAACGGAFDCDGQGAVCLSLPGGYCALEGCASDDDTCPDGSGCYAFQDGSSYCIQICTTSEDCRQAEGYVCDVDGTCWPGAENTAGGGAGSSPVGGECNVDADCADPGASCYPATLNGENTGFVGGYCLINGCVPGQCPAGSVCTVIYASGAAACVAECEATTQCRSDSGYACFSPGICFPGCGAESTCPAGWGCGEAGVCEPACTPEDCLPDKVCTDSGLCEDPPCTPGSCPAGLACSMTGVCVPDLSGGPGAGPGPTCSNLPPRDCNGSQAYCGDVVAFEPVDGDGYTNYPLNGETWANQYRSYARRDLMMLVKWATAYVDCKAGAWSTGNGYPLGLGDMSEANGSIPGTSDGSPGHPAGTHEDGYDIDMAYFQNEQTGQANNYLRPVCDHVLGGSDQYHCVSEPYLLDVWRSALFIGALFSSSRTRVIGVDGKAGALISEALEVLCADGWLPAEGCDPANQSLACEVQGQDGGLCWQENGSGWFHFHHHHMHLSLWQLSSNPSSLQAPRECIDEPCGDMNDDMDFMRKAGLPGLVKTLNSPAEPLLPWPTDAPLP